MIFKKFRCNICGEYKVGLLARWFGLYHCSDCENRQLDDEIVRLQAHNKNLREELYALLEEKANGY